MYNKHLVACQQGMQVSDNQCVCMQTAGASAVAGHIPTGGPAPAAPALLSLSVDELVRQHEVMQTRANALKTDYKALEVKHDRETLLCANFRKELISVKGSSTIPEYQWVSQFEQLDSIAVDLHIQGLVMIQSIACIDDGQHTLLSNQQKNVVAYLEKANHLLLLMTDCLVCNGSC